jgi:hypothetical protein
VQFSFIFSANEKESMMMMMIVSGMSHKRKKNFGMKSHTNTHAKDSELI